VERSAPDPKQAPASLDREERQALASRARESFDSAIAPLEAAAGRRLRGPWRGKWEAAFNESPAGFCRLRDDVVERPGVRSLFAYFNRLLEDGDHLAEPVPARPPRRNDRGRGLTAEEILELGPGDEEPTEGRAKLVLLRSPCSACEIGGGHHADGCELAP
jgi:hypothetical protein